MVKLNPMNDSDFETKGGQYFDAGVYEITITSAERGESKNTGTPYAGFDVVGPDGQETNVRLYLSEKAAERSRSILGAIAVHNKKTDAEKDAVRKAFKAITDTDQIDEKFLQKFVDMKAWILVEEDTTGAQKPGGGYYLRSNLYSYEPTPRKAAQVDAFLKNDDNEPVDPSKIPF